MAERVNLVTNPSFQTNTTGWSATGSGATIARVTSDSYWGSSSLEVTKSNTASCGVISSSRIPVSASTSYALSAFVKIPLDQEAGGLVVKAEWYDDPTAGSLQGTSTSSTFSLTDADGWTRVSGVFTSHGSATHAAISIVQPTAGTASKTFLVDAILFEQSSYVNGYIDEPTQGRETTIVNRALSPLPIPNITGMKLQADVSLGKLILNSIDENNTVWVCTDIDGWWVHPDPEVPDIPRGFSDGSYLVRGRYTARQIELRGSFLPINPDNLPAARNKLIEATDLVYSGAWLIVDENPPKASYVRLSGRPEITVMSARGRTDFVVGLRAGDPIKYHWNASNPDGYSLTTIPCESGSPAQTGLATITNSGNTPVRFTMRVTGPVVGPATITNNRTGDVLTIIDTVRGTATYAISTASRTGSVATITTSSAHWFVEGDVVTISGVSDSVFNGTFTITSVPLSTQFTFTTATSGSASGTGGTAALSSADVLVIDTYERQVSLITSNGIEQTQGIRAYLDTLIDWLTLEPGANELYFTDDGAANSTASLTVYYRSGWIG